MTRIVAFIVGLALGWLLRTVVDHQRADPDPQGPSMANTAEMLRLMRHAANLLDACDPLRNAAEVDLIAATTGASGKARDANRRAVAEVAAITTASTVLRMVAAAMDDEMEAEMEAEHDFVEDDPAATCATQQVDPRTGRLRPTGPCDCNAGGTP